MNLLALPRCVFCHHFVWWWQKVGFRVVGRLVLFYHPECYTRSRDIGDTNLQ